MKMKTLLTAAQAAGYAMAPSEEQFHAPDGAQLRSFRTHELSMREIAYRANVPALPSPARPAMAETWLKGVFGSMLTRRATA